MPSILHHVILPWFFAVPKQRKEPPIDQTPILNNNDLMLIRAALRFWQDEMSPNDLSLSADYFAPEERRTLPEIVDVAQLFGRLEQCRIQFVICDPDHEMILHSRLFESMAEAKQNCADHVAIATAIVPA